MSNSLKLKLMELKNWLKTIKTNDAKTVANTINDYINMHYDEIMMFANNDFILIEWYLGKIMKYYIKTRDTRIDYQISDIIEEKTEKYLSLNQEQIYNNVIANGFLTHSCNPYTAKLIEQNGLGSSLNRDDSLKNDLEYLENIIGKSRYLEQQSNDDTEVYFTSPGTTSFSYALEYAPERLFLGILDQSRDNSLPVIVGEKETEYYLRVIANKVKNNPDYSLIMDKARNVITKFCSDDSSIFLFPINDDSYTIEACCEVYSDNKKRNINDIIKTDMDDIDFFFTDKAGSNSNANNLDNLVMKNIEIPKEKLGEIKIPSRYKILQQIAILSGMKENEEFDFFTGEKISINKNLNQ